MRLILAYAFAVVVLLVVLYYRWDEITGADEELAEREAARPHLTRECAECGREESSPYEGEGRYFDLCGGCKLKLAWQPSETVRAAEGR